MSHDRNRKIELLSIVASNIFPELSWMNDKHPNKPEWLVTHALNIAEKIVEGAAKRVVDTTQQTDV